MRFFRISIYTELIRLEQKRITIFPTNRHISSRLREKQQNFPIRMHWRRVFLAPIPAKWFANPESTLCTISGYAVSVPSLVVYNLPVLFLNIRIPSRTRYQLVQGVSLREPEASFEYPAGFRVNKRRLIVSDDSITEGTGLVNYITSS